ncbi:endogenous retrovirus group K member 10 Gag polyprotein-like [Podargus strigoides]
MEDFTPQEINDILAWFSQRPGESLLSWMDAFQNNDQGTSLMALADAGCKAKYLLENTWPGSHRPWYILRDEKRRKFGDALWDAVIDGDKVAKKVMKLWREVTNCLQKYRVEKVVAAVASNKLEGGEEQLTTPGKIYLGIDPDPNPAIGGTVKVIGPTGFAPQTAPQTAEAACCAAGDDWPPPLEPSAPPAGEETIREEQSKGKNLRRIVRIDWHSLKRHAIENGDRALLEDLEGIQAFPVIFQTNDMGGIDAEHYMIDWKLLTQLRNTVNESGLRGEPTIQMLNYIWGSGILCAEDIKSIMRMIMTQSQLLLWQGHWTRLCEQSAQTQREENDPLFGVTAQQLLGYGPFQSITVQMELGPSVSLESMRLARDALRSVRTSPGAPSYMSIKQGREESFGSFVDRVTDAINKADVPEWMKGALLRQCVMENTNNRVKGILLTLPIDATIEDMLERMSRVPSGEQAMLVEAIQAVGKEIAQGQALQAQAFAAALAPLQRPHPSYRQQRPSHEGPPRCYRCGEKGHVRRMCRKPHVWCDNCQHDHHDTSVCHLPGNGRRSASRRATTTIAAPAQPATSPPTQLQPYSQPPQGASVSTWQQL